MSPAEWVRRQLATAPPLPPELAARLRSLLPVPPP